MCHIICSGPTADPMGSPSITYSESNHSLLSAPLLHLSKSPLFFTQTNVNASSLHWPPGSLLDPLHSHFSTPKPEHSFKTVYQNMTLSAHFLLPSLPTPSYPSPAEIDRLDEQHSIVVFSFLSSHEKRAKKSGPPNQHIFSSDILLLSKLGTEKLQIISTSLTQKPPFC